MRLGALHTHSMPSMQATCMVLQRCGHVMLQPKHHTSLPLQKEYAHVPTKYTKGGTTVLLKRIAVEPHPDQTAADASPSSCSSTCQIGGMTAMQSTTRSHTNMMTRISNEDPFYKTTSAAYGSRLPVEQFGIAHHALLETAVTRADRREFWS